MKIVIAGAGEVGTYLAKMLSKEYHNITLIDERSEILREVEIHDLLSICGSCTSFATLKEAGVSNCDLFIAVTSLEDTNILACVYAKKIGAKKTVARVSNMEYHNPVNTMTFLKLGVDKLIYPEYIAAKEVVGVIKQTGSTEIFEFSNGRLTLFVLKLDKNSPIVNLSLREVAIKAKNRNYIAVAITRNEKTIIPKGNDVLCEGDQIYIITKPEEIPNMLKTAGKQKLELNNVMILGGSRIGIKTAKFIENHLKVKLIENDHDKAFRLVDMLPKTMIINGDGRNIDLLIESGFENIDAFVAVTGDSETNILSCLLAKRYGIKKTIAEIENLDYIDIASKMGIDTIINKNYLQLAIFIHLQ